MLALASLRAPVDAFFDKVTVNVTGVPDADKFARQPPRAAVRDPRGDTQRGGLLEDRGIAVVSDPPGLTPFEQGRAEPASRERGNVASRSSAGNSAQDGVRPGVSDTTGPPRPRAQSESSDYDLDENWQFCPRSTLKEPWDSIGRS